jgi:hypothetical protein
MTLPQVRPIRALRTFRLLVCLFQGFARVFDLYLLEPFAYPVVPTFHSMLHLGFELCPLLAASLLVNTDVASLLVCIIYPSVLELSSSASFSWCAIIHSEHIDNYQAYH